MSSFISNLKPWPPSSVNRYGIRGSRRPWQICSLWCWVEYGGLFIMMRRTAYVTKIQHFEKSHHFCMWVKKRSTTSVRAHVSHDKWAPCCVYQNDFTWHLSHTNEKVLRVTYEKCALFACAKKWATFSRSPCCVLLALSWNTAGGGDSIYGVVKCLSPYFTQDWAFLTNLFAKYTCHWNRWELEAQNWFIEVWLYRPV